MSRPRRESELESLRAQQAALEKKIKEVAARERARQAAEEVRRNLLAGAAALEHMAAEPEGAFAATLLGLVNRKARSASDRALFGLPALAGNGEASAGGDA
jgi:hypothetical protein